MKVGIIGCGVIARSHCSGIMKQPDLQIVGIVDIDNARAVALAAELGVTGVYQDAAQMIDEQKPDAVHVLVPPQHHPEVSIMAMDKGCHVIVEKPMAVTKSDAERMSAAAKRNDVLLCAIHSKVFDDAPSRAIAMAKNGVLGEIVSVEAFYIYDARRNPAVLEEGAQHSHWSYKLNGGIIQDLMPHPASMIMEFVEEIEELHHVGCNRGVLPSAWQDEIRVLLKSEDLTAYISVSLSEAPDTISLTIKGTKGVVHADLFNNIVVLQKKSDLPRAIIRARSGFQLSWQYLKGALGNVVKFALGRIDKSGGIEPVIASFYEAVKNGSDSPVDPDKSVRVVELMERLWPSPPKIAEPTAPTKRRRNAPTVLLTGASGFIGTHLINRLLAEGQSVRALVRPNSLRAGRLKMVDVDIFEGDLTDQSALHEACQGIKIIYHLGSDMSPNWQDQFRVTVQGTKNIIQGALANEIDRFVHISSLTVHQVAAVADGGLVNEDAPYRQHMDTMGAYAYAKIKTEELVLSANQQEGLPATIVRPGIVIGPLGRLFFPHLGYRYKDKVFIVIGNGDNVLPLTYVENTVDAIYRASQSTAAVGEAFNLVDDGKVSVNDYLQRFKEVTGTSSRVVHVPYVLPYTATAGYEAAAALGIVKKGVTSRAQLQWKQASVVYDNSKAKADLGWNPSIPIDEGLIKTFEWHKSRS